MNGYLNMRSHEQMLYLCHNPDGHDFFYGKIQDRISNAGQESLFNRMRPETFCFQ
jgi:hypothetical protein